MPRLGGRCPFNVCTEHNSDIKEFARGELMRYYKKSFKELNIPEDEIIDRYCTYVCPNFSC